MDQRFIEFYHKGKVPNQVKLIKKLEEKGYENGFNNICTIKNFGVPVTIFVLLLYKKLQNIDRFQKEMDNEIAEIAIDNCNLPKEIQTKENIYENIESWDRSVSLAIDTTICNSGSMGFASQNWFYPPTHSSYSDLNEMYHTSSNNIKIEKKCIKEIKEKKENNIHLIDVFEELFIFFELSYALKSRIDKEIELFTENFEEIEIPNINREFNRICQQRGNIVHDNAIKFEITSKNELTIFGKKITIYFRCGLEKATEWIDDIYYKMHVKLNEK